ncbi:MAG: hypothetical protein ACYC2I_11015, partial [Elusimicrobiales bacterium]
EALSGTAADNGRNESVQVAMQQWGSPQLWYDGDGFNLTGQRWLPVDVSNGFLSPDATSWAYAPASFDSDFPGGLKYLLLIRSTDVAGNLQETLDVGISSRVVYVDKAPPATAVTLPADYGDGVSGRYKSADIGKTATSSRFYGTAADAFYAANNAGVEKTRVQLSYLLSNDTWYWLGTSFSSGAVALANSWLNTSGAGSWIYTNDIAWPAGDGEYRLEARSMDAARPSGGGADGNWETLSSSGTDIMRFIVDDTPPDVGITTPAVYALTALSRIDGTASAGLSGHRYTDVRISTTGVDGARYWTGSGWAASPDTWLQATMNYPTSWYYTVPPSIFRNDTVYTVSARSLDYAGNYSVVYATSQFTYDVTPPNVTLTSPVNDQTYSRIRLSTPLAGGSEQNDQVSTYAKVSTVAVQITDIGAGQCFTGSGFGVCPSWLPAQGTVDSWSYNHPALDFTGNKNYRVEARAADYAGNNSAVAQVTIKFDVAKPTSTITYPLSGITTGFTLISGTAGDGADAFQAYLGTYTVKLAFKRLSGSVSETGWWNGANFAAANTDPTWYEAVMSTYGVNAGKFTYALPGALQTYLAHPDNQNSSYRTVPWSYDLALNREYGPNTAEPLAVNVPAGVGVTFTYDNARPVSYFTAPVQPYYKSLPDIAGTSGDNVAMSRTWISIFNDTFDEYYNTAFTPNPWGPAENWVSLQAGTTIYQSSSSWTYNIQNSSWSSGAVYQVRARGLDISGNYDNVYTTATFMFDNVNPQSWVSVPSNNSYLNYKPSQVKGTSYDAASGLAQIYIYIQRATSPQYWNGTGWDPTPPTRLVNNPTLAEWDRPVEASMFDFNGNERFTVFTNALDQAGNAEGYSAKMSFVYDVAPPTSAVLYPEHTGYVSQTGKVTGGSYDMPNGVVNNIFVRIKQTAAGARFNMFYSVNGASWTASDTYNSVLQYGTLSTGATWWQLNASPWQSGDVYTIDSWAVDKAGNYQLVYSTVSGVAADFAAPLSTVTYPANGSLIQAEASVITGSASDIGGTLQTVRLSYYCAAVPCTGKYWDRDAAAWTSGTELFYDATSVGGGAWSATGVSTPTWVYDNVNGITYQIFARAVDQAGNMTAKPGGPADSSPYIQFTLKPPLPVSAVTTPNTSIPHYRPASMPTLAGTAIYASTVALRIIDYGPDHTFGAGNDDRAWNGALWVSTNVFNEDSYTGVHVFVPPDWQWTGPAWNGNRKYRVTSKGEHTGFGTVETPFAYREFIVDSTAPAAAVTMPNRAYMRSLASLSGTVSDIAPGTVVSAYFRIKQGVDKFYNWQESTFTVAGTYTDLPASLAWNDVAKTGAVSYTTTAFTTAVIFEPDHSYSVELSVTDKAGNIGAAVAFPFTVDISSPAAMLTAPYDANGKGVRRITAITGTAADNFDNYDVSIAIQKLDASGYWYRNSDLGFNEPSGPNWISLRGNTSGYLAADAKTWEYKPEGLNDDFSPAGSGLSYLVLVKARDVADNEQDVFSAVTYSSAVIKIDKDDPSSSFSFPADDADGYSGRYKSANAGQDATTSRLLGLAQDNFYTVNNAGVAAGRVRLSYLVGNTTWYWNGSAFEAAGAYETAWHVTSIGGAAPNWTWTYMQDITWPPGDREYRAESRVMDDARLADDTGDGNWQVVFTTVNFIVDDTPPTVLITTPSLSAVRHLPGVGGDVDAEIADFSGATVRISTGAGAGLRYWTGAEWTANVNDPLVWRPTTRLSNTSWYYTVDAAMLASDVAYSFNARALDYAGNYSTVYSTITVTYDISGPAVTLTYPKDAATYSQILVSTPMAGSTSSGQASPYTEASTVAVAISEVDGGGAYLNCFNGSVFAGCSAPLWQPAQGSTTAWTYTSAAAGLAFGNDKLYKYESRAADQAGNYSAVTAVTTRYDVRVPTSALTSPSALYVQSLPLVSGTASDELLAAYTYEAGLGTYTVKVAVRLVGGNWWDGAGTFGAANPVWYEAAVDTAPYAAGQAVVDWSYSLPASMKSAMDNLATLPPYLNSYLVVPWAYDLAQNREFGPPAGSPANIDVPAGVGRVFRYDNIKPVAVTTTPVNISYKNSVPYLYGIATDTGVVTGVQVLVKARGNFNATWKGTYNNNSSDWDDSSSKYLNWSTATYANGAWSLALPSLSPVNNHKISVWARAKDQSGNWQNTPTNLQIDNNQDATGAAAYYFTFDTDIPQTSVTAPDAYALSVATGLFAGAATEFGTEPSGVNEVRVHLHRSDNAYWSFVNSNWGATSADYVGVTGTTLWTKDILKSSQDDGYRYDVYHYANDNANNNYNGPYYSTFSFIVDETTPTSKVTFPVHNSFIGTVSYVEGTADDSVENLQGWSGSRGYEAGIPAAGVQVAIQELKTDKWWSGSGVASASRVWNTAAFTGASSGTWIYNIGAGNIVDGTTYYAMSRVVDNVGNTQAVYTTNYFTGDTTPPASRALYPTVQVSSVTTISGTAQDTLPGELRGGDVVRIALRKTAPTQACYDNATISWVSCPTGVGFEYPNDRLWFSTATISDPQGQPATWAWNVAALTPPVNWENNASYDLQAVAVDKAGNVRVYPGQNSPDITFNFQSPYADTSITTPASEWGNYRAATVVSVMGNGTNLRATNSVQVRVQRQTDMYYWDEPNKNWVSFDTYTFVNATGGAWSRGGISGPLAFTVGNTSYTLSSVGFNSANEAETPPTVRTIIVDDTLPVGAILSPAYPYVNAMPAITGTAADPGRDALPAARREGMSRVLVMIKDDAGLYWNGERFDVAMSSSDITPDIALPAWSTATLVAPALRDGRSYTVFAKLEDKAGNALTEINAPQYSVTYDTTTPGSRINSPAPFAVLRSLTQISGTALDPAGVYEPKLKSDLARVELQIYDQVDNQWWHNSGVSGAFSVLGSSFNVVAGTDTWTYSNASLTFTSGKYYILTSSAVDRAGNGQRVFDNNISSLTFIWDTDRPVSYMIQPVHGSSYKPADLSGVNPLRGTATDGVLPYTPNHINKVQMNLSYLHQGDTYYWTTTEFSSWTRTFDTAWLNLTGTTDWSSSFGSSNWVSDRLYTMRVRAFDTAQPFPTADGGNEQNPWTISTFTVDGTPPVSRISTPTAGSFIQASLAEISGTSFAGLSGQAAINGLKLRIYHTWAGDDYYWNGKASLGWSSGTVVDLPVAYAPSASTITWTYPHSTWEAPSISTNNHTYNISIAGVDKAGNTETPAVISVVSDFNYPEMSVSTPMAAASAFYGPDRPTGQLMGAASDSPAGIVPPARVEITRLKPNLTVEAKWDNDSWEVLASTWLVVADLNPWYYTPAPSWPYNKRFRVEAKALDYAGNQVPDGRYTAEFIYDVNKPSSTIAVPSADFQNAAQALQFSGSALDWVNNAADESMSGLLPDGIQVQVLNASNEKFNGTGFTPLGDPWRTANFAVTAQNTDAIIGVNIVSGANWSYPRAPDTWPPLLVEGSTYTVRVRAMDRSRNLEDYVQKSFCYDASAPTATVTMPGVHAYTSMPLISGTVSEKVSRLNAGDGVQVLIKRVSDGYYWDGADFTSGYAVGKWQNAAQNGSDDWSFSQAPLMTYFNTTIPNSGFSRAFTVFVRAKDIVNNKSRPDTEPAAGGVTFTIDPVRPSSRPTYPAPGAFLNAPITAINGTATDYSFGAPSGLSTSVRMRISRLNSAGTRTYYDWGDTNWLAGSYVFQTVTGPLPTVDGSTITWTKSIPAAAFTDANSGDGYRFELQTEAIDNTESVNGGPNTEVLYATSTFVLDFSTPTLTIQQPLHNGHFRTLSSFVGISTDPVAGGGITSGLQTIEYDLTDTDLKPNRYWNFNTLGWQDPYTSSVTAASENWTMGALPVNADTGNNSWAVGRSSATFLLRVKVTDRSGNYSGFSVNYSTFTYDNILPDSQVTHPAVPDGAVVSISSITGTASDYNAAISTVQLRIWQDTVQTDCSRGDLNGRYWHGASWLAGEAWLGVNQFASANSVSWKFNPSETGAPNVDFKAQCYYVVTSSAADNVGNGEATFGSRRFKFTPPPAGTRGLVPG